MRIKQGRNAQISFIIVDAQSVPNADTSRCKGYDAGKKISGIKRNIAVDTNGLLHTATITTANLTERKGTLFAFDRCKKNLSQVKAVLVGGGYTGVPFAEAVKEKLGVSVQVANRNELHELVVIPQCWVVERPFVGLDKCRRLWKNCERKLNTNLTVGLFSQFIAALTWIMNRLLN